MSAVAEVVPQTLLNLQTAYEGESNATIKYTAFAIQAEVKAICEPLPSSAPPHAASKFTLPIMRGSSRRWAARPLPWSTHPK